MTSGIYSPRSHAVEALDPAGVLRTMFKSIERYGLEFQNTVNGSPQWLVINRSNREIIAAVDIVIIPKGPIHQAASTAFLFLSAIAIVSLVVLGVWNLLLQYSYHEVSATIIFGLIFGIFLYWCTTTKSTPPPQATATPTRAATPDKLEFAPNDPDKPHPPDRYPLDQPPPPWKNRPLGRLRKQAGLPPRSSVPVPLQTPTELDAHTESGADGSPSVAAESAEGHILVLVGTAFWQGDPTLYDILAGRYPLDDRWPSQHAPSTAANDAVSRMFPGPLSIGNPMRATFNFGRVPMEVIRLEGWWNGTKYVDIVGMPPPYTSGAFDSGPGLGTPKALGVVELRVWVGATFVGSFSTVVQ